MAFSKQPVNTTYQTKSVNLVRELGSRGTSTAKDAYLQNMYVELQKNKDTQDKDVVLVKRAGARQLVAAANLGDVRGAWLWKDQNKLLVAVSNKIVVYDTNTLAIITTLNAVFGTGSGYVSFDEFMYTTTNVVVCASDGTTLVSIDTSNVVATAVGVPVHIPSIAFLDGNLYVVKTNSSSIYSSDDDDPLAWTSGDFIDAEMRADQVQGLGLLNNYLLAFGSKTIEYFYDGGNATGSPLSRNDSPMKAVGYVGGFTKIANKIYFVGEMEGSLPDVYLLEDFKITPLGTEPIRRHLEAHLPTNGVICSFNGHDFYVVSTSVATYAMDLENKLWSTWSYQGYPGFVITFSFPQNSSTIGYRNLFITVADDSINTFDNTIGTDKEIAFPVTIVSDNEFFESYNRKVANRLTIYADKPTSSLPILVQTSDDDYQTWSAGQTIDLFQELPCKYRWGQFRRRAHKLSYTGNLILRIQKLELDINLGST